MDIYQEEEIPKEMRNNFIEAPQIGLEDTPQEFVEDLMEVFREVKRVLKDTGTFYLNIDDTYSGGGGNSGVPDDWDSTSTQNREKYPDSVPARDVDIPDKCMSAVPERLMLALMNEGFILRNKIVWHKDGMPESVTDRFSTKWEYVYMFSLDQDYYFDLDAVREPHKQNTKDRVKKDFNPNSDHPTVSNEGSMERWANSNGKNPGDLWRIPPAQFSDAHFAVYPHELTKKPIKSSVPKKVCSDCGTPYEKITEEKEVDYEDLTEEQKKALENAGASEGEYDGEGKEDESGMAENPSDSKRSMVESMKKQRVVKGYEKHCDCNTEETDRGIILDPFAGAGTTLLSARKHNRDYIGIELNRQFAEMAEDRIKKETGGKSIQDYI